MGAPSSVMVECPDCGRDTLHEVLSGKLGGRSKAVMDSTVRCRECGRVHHVVLKVDRPVEIPVIISWMERSKRASISLGPDEVLSVYDEIMCGEEPVLVTAIESKGGRPRRARARDIQTIWGKRFDKVRVPISISHAGRAYSEHVLAVPDEEFSIGDMLSVGKHEVVIHTIKTSARVIKTGGAQARDIVRVYASVVRRSSY
ncbi:MAG: HVO_0476 family zinc finger protein [Thermoplasmata archaeon]